MKALQITGPDQAEIIDIERPVPGPGQVLVEIEAVNTCPQWDLHIMGGNSMFPGRPLHFPYSPGQPGHEAMGRVREVGEGVHDLVPGTRVAAWKDPGHDVLGSYAEFVVRDEADFLRVPEEISAEGVASLELAAAVQTAVESLQRLDAVVDQRIGVSGLGNGGLIAIQIAKAEGAREVIGFDLSPARRELALKLGADEVYDPRELTTPASRTSDEMLDAAVDSAGNGTSVQFLMDRTRRAVALFGVLRDDVRFGWEHWRLALLGHPSPPYHRGTAEAALGHIIAGELDLTALVSRTMQLSEYGEGVALLREQKALKICFRP